MLAGKPGCMTLHMGDEADDLAYVMKAVKNTGLPCTMFHPVSYTHLNVYKRQLQLYVSDSLRIVLLSFCSFMLMPIPLLVFINDALKLRRPSLTLLQLLLLGNTIVQCILYQAGILDFVQMLPITHFLMIISIAALLFTLIREVRPVSYTHHLPPWLSVSLYSI